MTHPYFDNGGKPIALAHRGFSLAGLENSMAAFEAAVRLGITHVETDAHGTADGIAVALHDAQLDRTTDSSGHVRSLTWDRVAPARIGGIEPVPRLDDLLDAFPSTRFNIDVKAASGIQPIVDAIERTRAHERVCIASFSTSRREATVARLSHAVATSAGTRETAAFALAAHAGIGVGRALRRVDALQVPVGAGPVTVVTARTVRAAHRAGKQVHVWTINDPEHMRALLDAGVDGLVSDRADLLIDVLRDRGQW